MVEVLLLKTPVDGVVAPIATLSIEPPVIVSVFETCASVATPTMSAKFIAKLEVANEV